MEHEVLAGEFCKNVNTPEIFAVGLHDGTVIVGNANKANKSISENCLFNHLSKHRTHVNAVSFVKDDSKLISISSEDPVFLRDINTEKPLECFTTNISLLKCLALNPIQKNVFIVGGRDNSIAIFDIRSRESVLSRSLKHFGDNKITYLSQPHWQFCKNSTSKVTNKNNSKDMIISTLSSITFINEWQFLTGSSVSLTEPVFTYKMPTSKRDYGIAHIAKDPKRSSFYAACTNNEIFIFSSDGALEDPMYTMINNIGEGINYSSRLAISPISDHLLVGTSLDCVKTFNLSSLYSRNRKNDSNLESNLPYSKYLLQGHDTETNIVNYSIDGKYILSGSSSNIRIWEYGWDKNFIMTGEELNQVEKPTRVYESNSNLSQPHLNFTFPTSKLGLQSNSTTSSITPKRKETISKRKLLEKNENTSIKKGRFFPLFNNVNKIDEF
ncbi:Denticleless protein homolog [Strongyloides ratti]|uniref:Denticleless protein homolog n=1 Tax=Strongyloides ratti TaxID=34506 RepID=A0A090KZL7_STRRB|nr:Denticleless protein homolog [Strongyloides ratti]CEF61292.1 Denticleless protein homolog [Strongyloides ratti]